MTQDLLQLISNEMKGFSKGQKLIARFILENYDKAAFMTASKLGKTVQVSESTVVRFATQLGYEGYPSMQRALQEMIRGNPAHSGVGRRARRVRFDDERPAARHGEDSHGHRPDRRRGI